MLRLSATNRLPPDGRSFSNRLPAGLVAKMNALLRQKRIVTALMLREMTTRYGREGLGFLWVIGEPLIFCFGVLLMWTFIKPAYEHGIRLAPFVMTGYMSLLLFRHQISFAMGALQANVGLLYHRQLRILHFYVARAVLEFLGTTAALVTIYVILLAAGEVGLPKDWLLFCTGWLLLGWMGVGLALVFASLATRFEVMERLVPVMSYALVPFSGAFAMTNWIPETYRSFYMLIPMPHGVEMVRAGVFGEFVPTHYDPMYAFAWGTIFIATGLILMAGAKDRVLVE